MEEAGSWRARCECRCADCAETQAAALCVCRTSRVVVCDRVWRAQAELLSIAGHTVLCEVIGSLARGKTFGLMHDACRGSPRTRTRMPGARAELCRADVALLSVRALMLPGPGPSRRTHAQEWHAPLQRAKCRALHVASLAAALLQILGGFLVVAGAVLAGVANVMHIGGSAVAPRVSAPAAPHVGTPCARASHGIARMMPCCARTTCGIPRRGWSVRAGAAALGRPSPLCRS